MGTITHSLKKDIIDNFLKSMADGDNFYYVFASHAWPWANENAPPAPAESLQGIFYEPTKGMLFGKRLYTTNIRYMVNTNTDRNWFTNTIFAQFDHTDTSLFSKNFFVITDERKVYKCLYNNRGSRSTIKPTLLQTQPFTTSDGYIWKYLFTVSSSDLKNFGSDFYIPVVANSTVTSAAYDGIDVVEVLAGGSGYITSTNGTVQSIDDFNPKIIQLENSARPDDDFYTGSSLYIINGTASGNVRSIEQYIVNSTGNWAVVNSAIGGLVPAQDQYEINPKVNIIGDGTGAKAICKTTNGVVTQVTVIAPGSGYTRAEATVTANPSYGKNANVIAYVPPVGGHGKDVISELGSDAIGINMIFDDTEGGIITILPKFRTVGLLKNPNIKDTTDRFTANVFSQVTTVLLDPPTAFIQGEIVDAHESGAQGHIVYNDPGSGYCVLDGDKNFASGIHAGEIIDGRTSGACSAIDTVYANGSIEPASGEVLYLTNFPPVERGSGKKETIKLVIQL